MTSVVVTRPASVLPGERVELSCGYQLGGGARLGSLEWYRLARTRQVTSTPWPVASSLVLILAQVLFFRLSGAGPGTLGTVYEHEWLSRAQVAYYLHNSSG